MFAWSVVVCHLFCQSLPLGRKCLAKDALMPCQAVIRFNSHPENFCFIAPVLNVFYLGTSDLSSPPGWGAGPATRKPRPMCRPVIAGCLGRFGAPWDPPDTQTRFVCRGTSRPCLRLQAGPTLPRPIRGRRLTWPTRDAEELRTVHHGTRTPFPSTDMPPRQARRPTCQ